MQKKKKWQEIAALDDALQHGLSEEEYRHLLEVIGRPINMVELGVCSALYSEHCSYKSTRFHLRNLPTQGPRVIHGPGENAGVVDIGDGEAVVFKVESHNHPSFIEPFQGAATGVGGILRDVFTMGARPLALMNALRFGSEDNSKTKYLLNRAVAGIGGYGNCMGVPTVGGELFFHESYNGNCLVNAFALGLVDKDGIFLGQMSGVGNGIFYVGSKTGRDGIHGATMASEAFDENSEEKRPTVQVGDPFQEKLLLEACLEVMKSGVVAGIQDMGAAGMTSSTYEMADRAGTGVRIHLDRVPQRELHMNPYEIMLSESQERMLLVVEQGKEEKVTEIFSRWGLDAVKIGEVTGGAEVELYWQGECISSLSAAVVTSSVPQYRWPEEPPEDFERINNHDLASVEEPSSLTDAWYELAGSLNQCSRHYVFNQYDSTVRTNTVIHPGGDAAVIRIKNRNGKAEKGVAMTLDCNSRYCSINPRDGTALSLAEAVRNLSSVGAAPIGISDCLNFGSPQRPEGMWQIAESLRGLADAARAFDVPVVSGNVSLYNETRGRSVMPTPMLAVVGLIEDASKCVDISFKDPGDAIFVIGQTEPNELGGSDYLAGRFGIEKGPLPMLDYDLEIRHAEFVRDLIDRRLLKSCHDVSSGGLAMALLECCVSQYRSIGAFLDTASFRGRKDGLLFGETGGRYIISSSAAMAGEIRKLAQNKKIPLEFEGSVGGGGIAFKGVAELQLEKAKETWLHGLKSLMA